MKSSLRLVLVLLSVVTVGCGEKPPAAPTTTRIIDLSGSLSFGNVKIGTSANLTFTILNTGNSPLTITGLGVSSPPGPAGFTTNWLSGTVPAGGNQQVTLFFTPTEVKSYGGTLFVTGNQTSGTDTIALTGTGVL